MALANYPVEKRREKKSNKNKNKKKKKISVSRCISEEINFLLFDFCFANQNHLSCQEVISEAFYKIFLFNAALKIEEKL